VSLGKYTDALCVLTLFIFSESCGKLAIEYFETNYDLRPDGEFQSSDQLKQDFWKWLPDFVECNPEIKRVFPLSAAQFLPAKREFASLRFILDAMSELYVHENIAFTDADLSRK
jgi:hypothetical protein